MIYIVEAFVEDYLHVLANVNIIKIFKNVYKSEQIVFISPKNHNENVKKYFEEKTDVSEFQSIKNINIGTDNIFKRIYIILFRIYRDFSLLNKIFKECKAGDKVVITHIYFPSLVLFKLIKKRYPNILTYSIIHGDVEYIYHAKTIQHKIVGFFHKLMFNINARNFYYIFLTPISKKILVETKQTALDQTLAIELPTFPNGNKYGTKRNLITNVLKIAHIGSAGTRKNVQLFYKLASSLETRIKNQELEFSTIGILEHSIRPFLNSLIVDHVDSVVSKPLSREKYDQEVSKLDYAIFFYGKNDFILRSSAAFFDAIFYEKPIIALKNTFFEDVFAREGEIGYLCNSLDEMSKLIEGIVSKKIYYQQKYVVLVENIKAYKVKLQLENISSQLKTDIKKMTRC